MTKKIKSFIPRIILLDTIIFILVFVIAQGLLHLFGMTFRTWVLYVFLILSVIGIVAGVIQLFLKIKRKSLKITLICIFSAIVIAASVVATPTAIFALSSEEYVVERDGNVYVARVVGWLDTYAFYFEYKNFLVQGRNLLIEEWYGNGGFDPLAGDHEYTPRRIIYYDISGNIIDVIETDNKK